MAEGLTLACHPIAPYQLQSGAHFLRSPQPPRHASWLPALPGTRACPLLPAHASGRAGPSPGAQHLCQGVQPDPADTKSGPTCHTLLLYQQRVHCPQWGLQHLAPATPEDGQCGFSQLHSPSRGSCSISGCARAGGCLADGRGGGSRHCT